MGSGDKEANVGHFTIANFIDTWFYMCIKTLNYMFMLLAMTYNFWVIFFMALGIATADFIMGYYNDRKYIEMKIEAIRTKGNAQTF